jgi:hypothetical protein
VSRFNTYIVGVIRKGGDTLKPFNVGDRVIVNVNAGAYQLKDAKATIVYMDYSAGIYRDEFFPVQVRLDEPYGESKQRLLRVTVKELRRCAE